MPLLFVNRTPVFIRMHQLLGGSEPSLLSQLTKSDAASKMVSAKIVYEVAPRLHYLQRIAVVH